MAEGTIETDVDRLISIVKKKGEMSLNDLAKEMKVPVETVQAWVDFLVEEKILGVEYKFTVPHVFFNRGETTLTKKQHHEILQSINNFKEDFQKKARLNKIPPSKIDQLWKNHLLNEAELKRTFFFVEARKRGFRDIESMWEEYKSHLEEQ